VCGSEGLEVADAGAPVGDEVGVLVGADDAGVGGQDEVEVGAVQAGEGVGEVDGAVGVGQGVWIKSVLIQMRVAARWIAAR
jgi:hypothetical protein